MNYYAFTAHSDNSFKVSTFTSKDVGDEYLHSQHGRGIVVYRSPEAGMMGHKLIVRTDITLDQLIERL